MSAATTAATGVAAHHCLHVPLQLPVQVLLLAAENVNELTNHHHISAHILKVILGGEVLATAKSAWAAVQDSNNTCMVRMAATESGNSGY